MKTLVLFAHPALHQSRINKAMLKAARGVADITVADLYADYPRHEINVEREQKRLLDHDLIVFQYPFHWYSCPPIIKEWFDLVLEHGFAYGHGGEALKGKRWLSAISTGAPASAYTPEGRHHFTLRQLLSPVEATANLCGMPFLAPFVFNGSLSANNTARDEHVAAYVRLLTALRDDHVDIERARRRELLTAADIGDIMLQVTHG